MFYLSLASGNALHPAAANVMGDQHHLFQEPMWGIPGPGRAAQLYTQGSDRSDTDGLIYSSAAERQHQSSTADQPNIPGYASHADSAVATGARQQHRPAAELAGQGMAAPTYGSANFVMFNGIEFFDLNKTGNFPNVAASTF